MVSLEQTEKQDSQAGESALAHLSLVIGQSYQTRQAAIENI